MSRIKLASPSLCTIVLISSFAPVARAGGEIAQSIRRDRRELTIRETARTRELPPIARCRPSQFGLSGERIITEYQPKENKTFVILRKTRFELGGHCEPLLLAEFSYEGREPQAPATVMLGFVANHFENLAFAVQLGDERFDLGKLARNTAFHQGNECRPLIRSAGVSVPRETFLRIAGATESLHPEAKATLSVGTQTLILSDDQVAGLRDLASRIPR